MSKTLAMQSMVLGSLLALAAGASGQTTTVHADVAAAEGDPDPIAQEAYIKASDTEINDTFGTTLSMSGRTLVVGASGKTGSGPFASGAAYVLIRDESGWSEQAILTASNAGSQDGFTNAISISGDTLVVGAPFEDSAATGIDGDELDNAAENAGAAYVYVRDGSSWTQQAYLKASNTEAFDQFGTAVAISGDTLVVSASSEWGGVAGVDGDQSDNSVPGAGAVYVFVRDGNTWTQQAYLKASFPDQSDFFGSAVALSGDTLLVGAYWESSGSPGVNGDELDESEFQAGAAYVFVRDGTTWSQQAFLKSTDPEFFDHFGQAVALEGDTAIIAAREEASMATGVNGDPFDNTFAGSGAVYVFTRDGTTWSQQAYLKASNTGSGDRFGTSVALSGDILSVGSWGEDSSATGVDGDQYNTGAFSSGAGYVFLREGTLWRQIAYLKASNTAPDDQFGFSTAVAGELVVMGAFNEDSAATGINGHQFNNNAPHSGAAYAFDLGEETPDPWSDEGSALAGVSGESQLVGVGTLAAETENSVELTNAAPTALAGLFLAFSSAPVSFKGGTLLPGPFLPPAILTTDGGGAIAIPFLMPAAVPMATELWVQWAIQDAAAVKGVALSNAILGITP
jgi:hypothetical protein